jgi:multidrug transporter EmrE-like cation transporter
MSPFFLACAILTTTVAQVLYKTYFLKKQRSYLIIALCFFVVTPFFAFGALKGLSLSTVYMSTGLSSVLIILSGRLFLKETLVKRQIIAICLLTSGVVLFNL